MRLKNEKNEKKKKKQNRTKQKTGTCSPGNFSWLRNTASSGSPGWLSCVNPSICGKQSHMLSLRRRCSKWSYSWIINTRGPFFPHKEKCSSSTKLAGFVHFQAFIFQTGLQRSSPARLIFPENSIALQENSAFVQPQKKKKKKALGLRFLLSVF